MPKRDMSDDEGEGKEGEGRGAEGDLLAKAIKHCWSDNFLDVFRAYFRKHADVFEVCECARAWGWVECLHGPPGPLCGGYCTSC